MNLKGKKKKNQVVTANIFEQQELLKKAEVIRESLTASTWHELETNGKFDKNKKLSFISDDMLILGCDVGSETHYMRAIDTRGRELSKSAFPFNNDSDGFQSAKEWAVKIAAEHNKSQIVLGLEPTGHYWFCLAAWMVSNDISVVQVNPYAVKQTKELEDNSQRKDDRKDPKLIANLVKDGNYGMPYLPEGLYVDLRRLSMLRGPADRRPDQEHQPPAQGDENLLSGIQGRVWEVGRGIHPGGLKSSPLPGGYRKIRCGRPEGHLA